MRSSVCLFVASVVAATSSVHAGVTQIAYASVTASGSEGFNAYAGPDWTQTTYNSIYSGSGMSFGKRFNGQSLSVQTSGGDSFDRLNVGFEGATGPLSLLTGAANYNLAFLSRPGYGGTILGGGPINGVTDGLGGFGRGSLAVLFDTDVSTCGLKIIACNGGTAHFSFFRRDGSVIGSTSITLAGDTTPFVTYTDALAFQSDTGASEIAGFSVWNTDPFGMTFDDFIYAGAAVPAPGAIAWLGMAGLMGRRRR
jgi:hypothetical protein